VYARTSWTAHSQYRLRVLACTVLVVVSFAAFALGTTHDLDGCAAEEAPSSITTSGMTRPVPPCADDAFFHNIPAHTTTQAATTLAQSHSIETQNAPPRGLAEAHTTLDSIHSGVASPSTTGALAHIDATSLATQRTTNRQWEWASVATPYEKRTVTEIAGEAHAGSKQAYGDYVPRGMQDEGKPDGNPTATAPHAAYTLMLPLRGSAGQQQVDCILELPAPKAGAQGWLVDMPPPAKCDQLGQSWMASPADVKNAKLQAFAAQTASYAQYSARRERESAQLERVSQVRFPITGTLTRCLGSKA
jgi:hypothetical protein